MPHKHYHISGTKNTTNTTMTQDEIQMHTEIRNHESMQEPTTHRQDVASFRIAAIRGKARWERKLKTETDPFEIKTLTAWIDEYTEDIKDADQELAKIARAQA